METHRYNRLDYRSYVACGNQMNKSEEWRNMEKGEGNDNYKREWHRRISSQVQC